MADVSWHEVARRASQGRDLFEQNYQDLPGKVRSLLKHLDPRSKSSRNNEKELAKLSEEEQAQIPRLLKYHQAFPLAHKYPKARHASKYKGKAGNKNHLISRDEMKVFNKRST